MHVYTDAHTHVYMHVYTHVHLAHAAGTFWMQYLQAQRMSERSIVPFACIITAQDWVDGRLTTFSAAMRWMTKARNKYGNDGE